MLAIVKLGLSLAMMISLGHIATRVCFHKFYRIEPRRPVYEEAALWFLFGSGLVSLLALWTSLINSAVGLYTILTTIIATLGLFYVTATRMRWGSKIPFKHKPGWTELVRQWLATPKSWLTLSLQAVLLCQVVGIAWASFVTDLGWDGLAIWGLKAKVFFLEGGVPSSYFLDLSRQWSHLNYPLLVPLAEAWVYHFLGDINEHLVKALFLAFFSSLLALFYRSIRRLHSSQYSLAFTLLLCVTPALFPITISGYADLPLSTFIFGSSAYLYFWLKDKHSTDLLLAAGLSALGVWVKREGSIAWLINLGTVVLWVLMPRSQSAYQRARAGIKYLLPALVAAPWLLFVGWQTLPENDFAPITTAVIMSNLHRLPALAGLLLEELISVRSWGVLWGLFLLAALYPSPKSILTEEGEAYLFVAVSAYIGLLALTFVFSIWQPYVLHVKSSLERLVFHVTPTAVFFVAIRLGDMDAWLRERLASA